MHTKIFLKLQEAIEGVFEDNSTAETIGDEQYITDNLAFQMAEAAKLVYDASVDKEKWLKENGYFAS
jgi:hypothetical protein